MLVGVGVRGDGYRMKGWDNVAVTDRIRCSRNRLLAESVDDDPAQWPPDVCACACVCVCDSFGFPPSTPSCPILISRPPSHHVPIFSIQARSVLQLPASQPLPSLTHSYTAKAYPNSSPLLASNSPLSVDRKSPRRSESDFLSPLVTRLRPWPPPQPRLVHNPRRLVRN